MAKGSRRLSNIGGYYKKSVTDPLKSAKIRRNEPCPCGSGEKYKRCCGSDELSSLEFWWRQRKIKKILKAQKTD